MADISNSGGRTPPTILGASHISRAIADDRFYAAMPEFLPILRKREALHADSGLKCGTCIKRRMGVSLSSDFISVMNTLSQEAYGRLKRYLGVDRLLVRAMDRKSGHTVLKEV